MMKRKLSSKTIDVKKEVSEAEQRIRNYIRETPVEFSPYLSKAGKSQVYLKLENLQITGSFKLRGAANKLLSLNKEEKEKGVVTASSGNHGAAFAYLLKKLHLNGTIYLPTNASRAKVEALMSYGTDVEFYGNDCVETERYAKKTAQKNSLVFVSPYNDLKIVGGQGTVGIELIRQVPRIDTVLVPVGGGGLISGIGGYLKSINKKIEIIGCQPENSPVMAESLKAGKIIQMESMPTLADGTAGGIEQNAVTFEICREIIDDMILVTEDEIKAAVKLILEKHYMLIEGAAALSVASFLKEKERFKNKHAVLVVSGSKISLDTLKKVLCVEV